LKVYEQTYDDEGTEDGESLMEAMKSDTPHIYRSAVTITVNMFFEFISFIMRI
jgi:hypothetical protein